MAVVAGVLLDHVAQDPAQAGRAPVRPDPLGRLAEPVAAVKHLRDVGAGLCYGPLPQGEKLLRGVLGGGAPFPVGASFQSTASHGGA